MYTKYSAIGFRPEEGFSQWMLKLLNMAPSWSSSGTQPTIGSADVDPGKILFVTHIMFRLPTNHYIHTFNVWSYMPQIQDFLTARVVRRVTKIVPG